MDEYFSRTRMLLHQDGMTRLKEATVVVLGLGGVGGTCSETLVRSGVGSIIVVDNDVVTPSNINRQIFATVQTIGMRKPEAALRRLKEINPNCNIKALDRFILMNTLGEIIPKNADYVIDCIDTMTAKLDVAEWCQERRIPVISSMGAGNKLDPTRLSFTDIYATRECPLARIMRRELKKRGVERLEVLYSLEKPLEPEQEEMREELDAVTSGMKPKRRTPGSVAFVPPVAGAMLAGQVIRRISGQ